MTEYLTQYEQGFIDGLRAYAINKDGGQYVGSPERPLRDAIDGRKETWNYLQPDDEMLEALEKLLPWVADSDDSHVASADIERARKAIAKARGEA